MNLAYGGVLVEGLSFPESPRWHGNRLWFSDFYQHKVFRVDMAGEVEAIAQVCKQPSGLGWLPEGDLLVVAMLDRKVLRVSGGVTTTHADLSRHISAPCNDMVVADDGTAYVGNFGYDHYRGEAPQTTVLIKVTPQGDISMAADELLFPNGGAFSKDRRHLYLAESFANRILRFSVSPDGNLQAREVFYRADGFFPDGLCLDSHLGLWVADPVSKHLLHLDSQANVLGTAKLPKDRLPIACAIGGPNDSTLFVASNTGLGPCMAHQRNGRIEMFALKH